MHYHMEANSLIRLTKRLYDTYSGGFSLHQLSPENLSLYWLLLGSSLLNIDISLPIQSYSTKYSIQKLAVRTHLHLINQRVIYLSSCVLLWTWISILKCSNAFKTSLSVNTSHILRSQPTIAFWIQHFLTLCIAIAKNSVPSTTAGEEPISVSTPLFPCLLYNYHITCLRVSTLFPISYCTTVQQCSTANATKHAIRDVRLRSSVPCLTYRVPFFTTATDPSHWPATMLKDSWH